MGTIPEPQMRKHRERQVGPASSSRASRPSRAQGGRPERATPRAPTVSVASFRHDSLFPRIERAVGGILAKGKVVAPVDVLVGMGLLAPEKLEDWRRGRVPYLEKVINCNLTRLSRLLRILRFHAHDLKLVPCHARRYPPALRYYRPEDLNLFKSVV